MRRDPLRVPATAGPALLGTLLGILLGAVAAAPAPPPPPASSIDPFYLALYREGVQSFEDGRAKAAAQMLRIACFGMLDAPPQLGDCLVRLGLAQAEADDKEGFVETFRHVAAIEERFNAYRQAALAAEVRSAFEAWLIRLIPEQQLAAVPAFAPLARERQIAKLRRLPARERRPEIDRQIKAEPENPRWQVLSAELLAEQGNREAALREVEAALTRDPAMSDGHCLRGRLLAGGATCARALEDLDACPALTTSADHAEAALGCRLALGQTGPAAALLAVLPEEVAADRRIAKLARQLEAVPVPVSPPAPAEAKRPPPPASQPAAPVAAPVTPSGAVPASPVRPEPAQSVPPSAETRRQLDMVRQSLAGTQHAGELTEPLRQARQIADANPTLAEAQLLVAEIAYRASRFKEAAEYFRRGGDPGESRPVLLFYMAVSYYEDGDRAAAAAVLRRCLGKLERTAFVEAYREKILGGAE